MTRPRILLLGAGGHGKAIADLLLADGGYEVAGFVDAAPKASQVLGLPVLGDESLLAALAGQGIALAHAAVGDNAQRLAAAALLRAAGFALPSLTHPVALIGYGARVGEGAAILARAVIGPEAEIGALALINTGAIVEHDCVVEEAAHIGPGAVLAGGVRVGAGALIGAGAVVRPGVVIGAGAVVGAGAAVVEDVAPGARVAGVPARPV
ncbi:MAG: NeuD/PglB/VioB family sugar acetyltransferase [Roseomonas sp.]|nr:NeuD/PglB/VioB family sugar acetyltransferase [Roseomonas sp.]